MKLNLAILSALASFGSVLANTPPASSPSKIKTCKVKPTHGATTSTSGIAAVETTGSATATSSGDATATLPPTTGSASATATFTCGGLDQTAVMATAAVDVGTPAPTLSLEAATGGCKCGYNVKSLGSTGHSYFRKMYSLDFSSIEDTKFTSADGLADKQWLINEGRHVGGPSECGPNANQCLGDPGSISVQGGNLLLTMAGGQTPSANMKCPEVSFLDAALYGVFQASIQLTDVPGTCEAFWLNHTAADVGDELDIEVISDAILTANAVGTGPGLYSTSWDPGANPNMPMDIPHDHGLSPFPAGAKPVEEFNNYTIAWLPDSQARYFNGQPMATTNKFNAIHPMNVTINNWSNGAAGWSGLPPAKDSVMKVKSLLFYYNTESEKDMPSECKKEDVCSA